MKRAKDPELLVTEIKMVVMSALGSPLDPSTIREDEPLWGSGLNVSSRTAVQILTALEDRFGVEFPDETINPGLFLSIRRLADAVSGLLPESAVTEAYKDSDHF